MLEASRAQGLEGIIAKRLDSTYTPGRRTPSWVKVKNVRRDRRRGRRLAARRGQAQRAARRARRRLLRGRGAASTRAASARGSTRPSSTGSARLLADLARADSPFDGRQPPRETKFVEPVLVAAVGYGEWTQARTLRHPRYLGLRDDLDPETVEFDDS